MSILLRGVEGFGLRHQLRTDSSLTLSQDLPAVAVAVDTRQHIEALPGEATALTGNGLVMLERARMQTGGIDSVSLPEELDETTKLTVYLGRKERVDGVPAFIAVCDLMHRRGITGATTLLGVDGTSHGDRALQLGRHVPTLTIVIDTPDRIAGSFDIVDRLTSQRGLVTSEMVPALRATAGEHRRGGVRLAKHRF